MSPAFSAPPEQVDPNRVEHVVDAIVAALSSNTIASLAVARQIAVPMIEADREWRELHGEDRC
jgi:hypothetical protein